MKRQKGGRSASYLKGKCESEFATRMGLQLPEVQQLSNVKEVAHNLTHEAEVGTKRAGKPTGKIEERNRIRSRLQREAKEEERGGKKRMMRERERQSEERELRNCILICYLSLLSRAHFCPSGSLSSIFLSPVPLTFLPRP